MQTLSQDGLELQILSPQDFEDIELLFSLLEAFNHISVLDKGMGQ